jgi:hypothetical protein
VLKHCAKESDWSMDKKYGQRVWTKELSLLWIAAMDMVTVLDDTHEVWRGHGSWKGRERTWRSVRPRLKMIERPVRIRGRWSWTGKEGKDLKRQDGAR